MLVEYFIFTSLHFISHCGKEDAEKGFVYLEGSTFTEELAQTLSDDAETMRKSNADRFTPSYAPPKSSHP
jgi:hypothetical protein